MVLMLPGARDVAGLRNCYGLWRKVAFHQGHSGKQGRCPANRIKDQWGPHPHCQYCA